MPAAYEPTADDVTAVALFLFSVASSPLPESFAEAAVFQLDRTTLWKVAAQADLPMGRNNFNRVVEKVAESSDAVTVDRFVGNNRRFVRLTIPTADEYVWLEETLANLELEDLTAAAAAAAKRGFQPAVLTEADVLPYSQGASERAEDPDSGNDDAEVDEAERRTCTKCATERAVTEYPTRYNGRLSSWCQRCHSAASLASKAQNPARSGDGDSINPYADRDWEEVQALMPEKKRCPRCRETLYASAFNFDRYRRDGLAVYCRPCRYNDRLRAT